jgi:hypothetical protein
MIGKPILRVGKIKRFGRVCPGSVDGHLSRSVPTPNADPQRLKDNVWICGAPGEIGAGISKVLEKAGISKSDLRKDAVIANDILLSISPEWFRPENPDRAGTWEPEKLEAFREQAEAFLRKEFGVRLCAAVLHLDESTPHVQAIVVPIVKRPGAKLALSGKDYFGPEKLKALQEAWQKRLEPLGVGPREVGSKARHTTIRSYYSALRKAPQVPEAVPPSPPTLAAVLRGGAKLEAWQKDEAKKVEKRQRPLAAAAAKGMLYEAEKRAGETKQAQLKEQYRKVGSLRSELGRIASDLEITKEQIALLRGISIAEVAEVLGFTGEIGRRENAIDLVKRVGDLNFEEATRWLAVAFGPAAAGAAVKEHTAQVFPPSPPLSKADQVKAGAIRAQLAALDAPAYRITIMSMGEDGEKIGRNLGKAKDGGPEQTWSKDQVVGMIPRLTAENARGGNIFITPLDDRTHHALIDDVRQPEIDVLRAAGYSFATLVETSPGNHQGVVKIAASAAPATAVNEWFKAINRELGDEKITGLRHPMRLAGFQNRKAKYEDENGHFPFVRVVEAAKTFCAHAKAVVVALAEQMTSNADALPSRRRGAPRA